MKLFVVLVYLFSFSAFSQNTSQNTSDIDVELDLSNPILGLNIYKRYDKRGRLLNEKEVGAIDKIYEGLPYYAIKIAMIQIAIEEAKKKGLDQAYVYDRYIPIDHLLAEIALYRAEMDYNRKKIHEIDVESDKNVEPIDFEFDLLLGEVNKLRRSIEEYFTHKHNMSFWLDREGLDFNSPREQIAADDQKVINELEMAERYILEALSVLRNKIDNLEAESRGNPILMEQLEEVKFIYNSSLVRAAQNVRKKFDIASQDRAFHRRPLLQQLAFKTINTLRDNKYYTVPALLDSKKLAELFYFEFNYNEADSVLLNANSRVSEIAKVFGVREPPRPRSGAEEAFIYLSLIKGQKYVPVNEVSSLTMTDFKYELDRHFSLKPATSKYEMVRVGESAYKAVLSCSYLFSI